MFSDENELLLYPRDVTMIILSRISKGESRFIARMLNMSEKQIIERLSTGSPLDRFFESPRFMTRTFIIRALKMTCISLEDIGPDEPENLRERAYELLVMPEHRHVSILVLFLIFDGDAEAVAKMLEISKKRVWGVESNYNLRLEDRLSRGYVIKILQSVFHELENIEEGNYGEGSDETVTTQNRQKSADSEKQILKLIKKAGFQYNDKREKGGSLWIIAGKEEAKELIEECKGMGYTFIFTEKGGKATDHKPGWYSR